MIRRMSRVPRLAAEAGGAGTNFGAVAGALGLAVADRRRRTRWWPRPWAWHVGMAAAVQVPMAAARAQGLVADMRMCEEERARPRGAAAEQRRCAP